MFYKIVTPYCDCLQEVTMGLLKEAVLLYLLSALSLSTASPFTKNVDDTKATPSNEEYKLANEVTPEHYDVELTLPTDFGNLGTFSGVVKITIKATKINRAPISVHLHDETLSIVTSKGAKLYEEGSSVNLIQTVTPKDVLQMITIDLVEGANLYPAKKYILEIPFIGILPSDMYGFYKSSYKDAFGYTEWIATTQFQPTHARKAFPCFDEPQYKATFLIQIIHPEKYHAISNAEIDTVVDASVETEARKKTIFKITPKMSTYLIAFVVSKYVSLSLPLDNIANSVLSPIETIDSTKYGLVIAPKLLNVMKDFTLIPYSAELGKLDQISIPDFSAGAMENWGLVTYRENALHWDPTESSARNKQRVGTVVAHELAHMWFGNLVTLKWWSSTWLNEGFARYFEYHATAEVEKDWELDKQFVIEQHQVILNSDSSMKSPVLTSPVYTPDEISGKFGSITYSKGGSVIRMMAHFLGNEAFKNGIREYLSKYSFGNTEPINLWSELQSRVNQTLPIGKQLSEIMTTWTMKPGFPLVTVELGENNKLAIKQEQFLFDATENSSTLWDIPITYATNLKKSFDSTLPEEWLTTVNKPLSTVQWSDLTTWIVLNIQDSAYIRVNYDTKLWNGIKDALKKADYDGIITMNRAQIVDDALNLARAGKLTYENAFDIVFYLENETEYYPWYPAFNAFAYLRRRIDSTSNLATLLDKFVSQIMKKFHEESVNLKEEKQIDIHKKVLAWTWACQLGHADCVQSAKEQFNKLKTDNIPVNPNLRSAVYCTVLRHSTDKSDWEFLWKRFTETRIASEASVLLTALGCTKDETLLNDYLEKSLSADIRKQDGQTVFTAVISGNPEGIPIGLKFLDENHAEIASEYGGMNALTSVITGLADRLTTEKQITDFESFVEKNKGELKEAALIAESAIQTAKSNLKWVDKFKADLEKYLQDKVGGDDGGGGDDGTTSIAVNYVMLVISAILVFTFNN